MAFYRREGQSLLDAPTFVEGPNFTLQASLKDTYAYPVGGWCWFDSLDAAMSSPLLRDATAVVSVTKRQAQLALLQYGLLDEVEAAIAAAGREAQIEWNAASTIERTNPLIETLAKGVLGFTDAQLDQLFTLASTM